jgi:hypothetical protein
MGNVESLRVMGEQNGIVAEAVAPVPLGDLRISSGRIREALVAGDTAKSAPHIRSDFAIVGVVDDGDLFTQFGAVPTTQDDIVPGAIAAEDAFHSSSVGPATAPTIRKLAELKPRTLALMHGPTFFGDGADALNRLADYYEGLVRKAA